MRTKTRRGARNFAWVIFPGYTGGNFSVCRGTDAALAEKNAKRFEAVAQITDKYQRLNGSNPAFFLEPERYKGTN
jgi:hypothetical protein